MEQAAHEGGFARVHVAQYHQVQQRLAPLTGRFPCQPLVYLPRQLGLCFILPQRPLRTHLQASVLWQTACLVTAPCRRSLLFRRASAKDGSGGILLL